MIANKSTLQLIGLVVLVALIDCTAAQLNPDPCAGTTGQSFLPHPTNCTLYISCYEGVGYEQPCPPGYFFNASATRCDVKEGDGCPVSCPPDGIAFLPDPAGRCEFYVICIAGTEYPDNECAPGLYFDVTLEECNYANATDCVNNPCSTDPATPQPEIYPNEVDCTKYILCLAGEPIERQCPTGLHFDTTLLKCVEGECPTDPAAPVDPAPVDPPPV
ncbi:peritrophin-1-like [Anopheles albimanus]|uniref:Chitin-binding type-2 domain-containing protein n=1 Tax=Anopheles albimanus TaxID=7167 RepID=A0A182FBV2_ANOAL|nr:peritrophin-1-like [Anopheles albimanus]